MPYQHGSQLQSAGDVTIAATGGDLNIIGSQLSGTNVVLAAANNLNILSQAEEHSDTQPAITPAVAWAALE